MEDTFENFQVFSEKLNSNQAVDQIENDDIDEMYQIENNVINETYQKLPRSQWTVMCVAVAFFATCLILVSLKFRFLDVKIFW